MSPSLPYSSETPNIIVNHSGFFIRDKKKAVFPDCGEKVFEIQDMAQNASEALGQYENWKTVFRGSLTAVENPWGKSLTGDFSALQAPGIYRAVLPNDKGRSYIFPIHDGVLSGLPRQFLDYLHFNRCGNFENEQRGPCHLDDGILSKTGQPIDASGGWHDAGDTRKWMVHCVLPAHAMAVYKQRYGTLWNHWNENPWNDDLLAEIAWGIRFILKMQDPVTGMIYEDVGGGGTSRKKEGMTWWYANHAGCCADNSENRFTDNLLNSGDERPVRDEYNPIVQYTNITILQNAAPLMRSHDTALADRMLEAATRCWRFMEDRITDDFHKWTSVRAWRLIAALAMKEKGAASVDTALDSLLQLFTPTAGCWFMDESKSDFYRGILHSAQPLIALTSVIDAIPHHPKRAKIEETIRHCMKQYVQPMQSTNPFRIIPFGLYPQPATQGDHYRKWNEDTYYRFFMPDHSPQRVNHGLGAHWTSWAHALAYVHHVMGIEEAREAALDQIRWMIGNNPTHTSFINGLGYNHPMPHSRFLGQIQGGIMIGPRGNAEDEFYVDRAGRADWSTCEYWVTNAANMLLALSYLLPQNIPQDAKLGRRLGGKPL
jgi:hypothetical protein